MQKMKPVLSQIAMRAVHKEVVASAPSSSGMSSLAALEDRRSVVQAVAPEIKLPSGAQDPEVSRELRYSNDDPWRSLRITHDALLRSVSFHCNNFVAPATICLLIYISRARPPSTSLVLSFSHIRRRKSQNSRTRWRA